MKTVSRLGRSLVLQERDLSAGAAERRVVDHDRYFLK